MNSLEPTESLNCLMLGGATASGKSAVALCLAEQLNGEIVSVDSMQVYRGMNIGTAKPTLEDQKRVPHHLLDILNLTEAFDAASFLHRARQACEEIRNRGRLPVLCGGTGLYFKVFLEGMSELPPSDERVRTELRSMPLSELLSELQQCDPLSHERIDRQNLRRVLRAVEVFRLTGRPFSSFREDWSAAGRTIQPSGSCFVCLEREIEDRQQRIDERVDWMFCNGLVEETRQLLEQGLEQNPIAMQALGYRQVVEFFRHEIESLPETVKRVKTRTRQFAKKQMTWFRHQAGVQWVPVGRTDNPEKTAEHIRGIWEEKTRQNVQS